VADRIAIASDHAAVEMKTQLVEHLRGRGYEVLDLGTAGTDSVDYPDFGYRIADAIASGEVSKGVSLCGSGIGISIAVNRHPACRCALVSDGLAARLAREQADTERVAALQEARREANEILQRAQKIAQESRDADIAAVREEVERIKTRATSDSEAEK